MRILIILLFISINSFGQITLQDILAIDDVQSYKRLMIENGFQRETGGEYDNLKNLVSYRKEGSDKTLVSFSWLDTDSLRLGGVTGYFSENMFGGNEVYDAIYDEVKKGCKFFEVRNSLDRDVAYYNCPDLNADPRLIALDNHMQEYYPEVWDRGFRASDVQIGFTKTKDLFMIEYPMQEIGVEDKIKLVEMMLEMSKKE